MLPIRFEPFLYLDIVTGHIRWSQGPEYSHLKPKKILFWDVYDPGGGVEAELPSGLKGPPNALNGDPVTIIGAHCTSFGELTL